LSKFNKAAQIQTTKVSAQHFSLFVTYMLGITIITSNIIPAFGQTSLDSFVVETMTSGIQFPTGMTFLGPDDILVIEKNKGTVQRVASGQLVREPLLDVPVANQVERGMLGIAALKNSTNQKTYVFLYYTESEYEDGGEPVGNRLYRYELVGNKLTNPKLLLDLPYLPGPAHNGGAITLGPDNNVYVIVGNLHVRAFNEGEEITLAQNIKGGEPADGRGGILRVTQDGQIVKSEGILGEEHPLDMYYAYGIRNGFGIAFDPVANNLWDTENSAGMGDEINLVEPGFNSGFNKISGSSSRNEDFNPAQDLVNFNGRGIYSDPELDLGAHIAPTALVFLTSNKYGDTYENDMFVASAGGRIFHFSLSEDRNDLILEGSLQDKVAEDEDDLEDSIVSEDLEIITDLEVGPDGYLYGTMYGDNGNIFRILPSN
jgi:aldose sugar dehydrogenase